MKKKKIKKIILSIIVSIIALISVFSCVKGKYTPEPILSPVSVLKPANSVNNNAVNPTGTYEYLYFNTSLDVQQVVNIMDSVEYNVDFIQLGFISDSYYAKGYFVIIDGFPGKAIYFNKYKLNESQSMYSYYIFYDDDISTPGGNRLFSFNDINENPLENGFQGYDPVFNINITGVSQVLGLNAGTQNNLLTNLVSPVPFLFEGDINYEQSSTGFEDVTQVESLYINTNYKNETLKTLIDEKVGYNDISFSLTDENTTHTIRINNTTYECYIYLNNNYIYIYNYNETAPDVYWYGYSPTVFDNNLLLFNVDLYSLSGWDNDLSFLFSETNDFGGDAPTYEEGYANGYNAGYENGYSSGVNNVTSNPNDYNLYTYNQYQGNYTNGYNAGEEDGYNRGYLDGLDDGADTNISFQYINSVLDLVGNFLNIEILPGIKLSYALGIIIILTIISIIKMVVK